jgi:NhaA family Na+:H+ antiporter
LLAQAATALSALEKAEGSLDKGQRLEEDPAWEWASRNLSAASARMLSPADRVEETVAPWSTYLVLPLFAFSATGIHLTIDISGGFPGRMVLGIALGLIVGKPAGILGAGWLGNKLGIAAARAAGARAPQIVGAAMLCGMADTVALLLADTSLPSPALASVAKLTVITASGVAAALGSLVIVAGTNGMSKKRSV